MTCISNKQIASICIKKREFCADQAKKHFTINAATLFQAGWYPATTASMPVNLLFPVKRRVSEHY